MDTISSSFAVASLIFAAGLALVMVAFIIYQVFFHPLAKYPGPFISKFSSIPNGYHAWKGDIHLDMWIAHEIYGPIVRYGPNMILFNSPQAVSDIYGKGQNISKGRDYTRLRRGVANLITLFDDQEHKHRRHMMGPAFSESFLRGAEPRILGHIDRFCEMLHPADQKCDDQGWGPSMLMSDWCSYLTVDIMTDVTYGVTRNLLGSDTSRSIIASIENSSVRLAVLVQCPFLYAGRLDRTLFPKAIRGRLDFKQFVDNLVTDHLAQRPLEGTSRVSIFSQLTKDSTLSRVELLSEASNTTIAGYDTTATALCAILFYLSHSPHAYAQLAHEVRSRFNCADDIRFSSSQLRQCQYLRACIDESLRLSPPVSTSLNREVRPGGAIIDGEYVPAGCGVATSIYALHHNPVAFPRPFEFIPERWLGGDEGCPPQTTAGLRAFNPFSRGPRGCIGKPLAYWELMCTVGRAIYTFDFRVATGVGGELGGGHPLASRGRTNPSEFQLYDRISCGKKGPILQFRARQNRDRAQDAVI